MSEEQQTLDELREALGPDFDVKRRLGRGAMASVYLARESGLDRLVAIKVLLPSRARDETAKRRFEREAKASASLTHENVVDVYRFGRLPDDTPYLVMRYVKGRTMEDRLEAEGRLPVELTKRILAEVAAALAVAHSHGIVHRDVRPGNVLWDEDAERALLSDFGIAALTEASGEDATRLTKTGQMLGDPRYLSPEQLRDEDVTELSDIYAFGVLGYELFTGAGPYEARTNTQWITAHLGAEPKDIREMRPEVDAGTAELLRRCLNREPKHRPSAAQIAQALAGGGQAQAGVAHGSGSVEQAADFEQVMKRRVPWFVGMAVTAGGAILGGMNVLTADQGMLDPIWFRLSLPFVVCGVAAATVVAWFHGERGQQESSVLEWMLLSVIGVVWLSISVWIFLSQ